MDRSILTALADQVLDALARTESEPVLLTKSDHVGNSLMAPRHFFIANRRRHSLSCLESPFDDFFRRPAHTSGQRRFEQFLPVR